MSARRTPSGRSPRPGRRLLGPAGDVLAERAPWLTEQVYRAVAAPLQRMDPEGAARFAEARLDGVRERLAALAARPRLDRGGLRRVQRDLARTREDLDRITDRLPPVRALALARRVAGYQEVTAGIAAAPPESARSLAETLALTGAGLGTSAVVFLPLGNALLEGGVLAGSAAAAGLAVVRRRRTTGERRSDVARALAEADRASRAADGADLLELDAARRDLVRRALASARLDATGEQALRSIDDRLDALLARLVQGDLEADAAHLVQAAITRYLPDTLHPFLALADPQTPVRGRPAAVEVAEQLAAIDRGLADVAARPGRSRPETLLGLQGEFLRDRFRPT